MTRVARAVGQGRQVDAGDAPGVAADRGAAAVDDGAAGVDQGDADGLAVLDAAGAARQGDAVVLGVVDDVVTGDDGDADRRRGGVDGADRPGRRRGCVAGGVRDAGGDGVAGAVRQGRQVYAGDAPGVVADRGAAAVDDGTAGVDQGDADGLAVLDAAGAARQGDAVVLGVVDDVVTGDDGDADRRGGGVHGADRPGRRSGGVAGSVRDAGGDGVAGAVGQGRQVDTGNAPGAVADRGAAAVDDGAAAVAQGDADGLAVLDAAGAARQGDAVVFGIVDDVVTGDDGDADRRRGGVQRADRPGRRSGCVAGSVRDAGGDGVAGAVGQGRQVYAGDAPGVVADRGAAAVDDGAAGVDQGDADGLAVLDATGAARQGDAVVFGVVDDVVAGDDGDADRRRDGVDRADRPGRRRGGVAGSVRDAGGDGVAGAVGQGRQVDAGDAPGVVADRGAAAVDDTTAGC
jgi:hypothetical protein